VAHAHTEPNLRGQGEAEKEGQVGEGG
jgi:hypothetical protein